jgi:hypothetical protein
MSKKQRILTDVGTREIYNFFREHYSYKISAEQFLKILRALNKRLTEYIFEGVIFNAPNSLGMFYVERKKPVVAWDDDGNLDLNKTTVATDWGETKKLWLEKPELKGKTFLLYENFHTGGYKMKIKWNKATANVSNIATYAFKPARGFKRNLAKFIKTTNKLTYYDH